MSEKKYCSKHPDTEINELILMPFMTTKWCPKCQPDLNEIFNVSTINQKSTEAKTK